MLQVYGGHCITFNSVNCSVLSPPNQYLRERLRCPQELVSTTIQIHSSKILHINRGIVLLFNLWPNSFLLMRMFHNPVFFCVFNVFILIEPPVNATRRGKSEVRKQHESKHTFHWLFSSSTHHFASPVICIWIEDKARFVRKGDIKDKDKCQNGQRRQPL